MLIIKIKKEDNLDKALKDFKLKTRQTKLIQEIRKREFFEKPSMRRRKEKQKAIYIQSLKDKYDL